MPKHRNSLGPRARVMIGVITMFTRAVDANANVYSEPRPNMLLRAESALSVSINSAVDPSSVEFRIIELLAGSSCNVISSSIASWG